MAESMNEAMSWTWSAMEPEPTEQERQLYDQFVDELLVDNNITQAASRCGFQAGFAEEYGKRFYRLSYVQRRLAELRRKDVDSAKDIDYDKACTVNTLRRVMMDDYQRGAARVAAARALSAIRGFDAPVKAQMDINARGGVVLLPGIASLDDWETAARDSQRHLADESRVD